MARMKVKIEGKEYAVDELELIDLMPVEKELGVPFGQWDFDSLEVCAHLAHVLIGKERPGFTFEDATHLKISVMLQEDEAEDEAEDDAGPPANSEAENGSSGTASESIDMSDAAVEEMNGSDQPVVAGLQ